MFNYKGRVYEYTEGQESCYNCGMTFVPEGSPSDVEGHVVVTCPNGCRGSWATLLGHVIVVRNTGEMSVGFYTVTQAEVEKMLNGIRDLVPCGPHDDVYWADSSVEPEEWERQGWYVYHRLRSE